MSEQELNSYRFLSGQEPTDEMLYAIMADARDAAIKKANDAQKKFDADYERQYRQALSEWHAHLSAAANE